MPGQLQTLLTLALLVMDSRDDGAFRSWMRRRPDG